MMHNIYRVVTLPFISLMMVCALMTPALAVELTLYIWEDYIAQEVLDSFREKTGITVRQVYYDSDQNRDEVLASARGKQFDIVIIDNVALQIFGKNNHLLAVNEPEVPNISHIDKQWQESCGNFGVPYFYGTIGLVYDKTRYAFPPDSWEALLFPDDEHRGHVVMVEDMVDTLLPGLIYLGHNINSENEEELKEVYQLLQQQVPAVLNYKYAISNSHVLDKERSMHIALAYTGDNHTMNEVTGTENWEYIIPREGTAIWMDCMSVTAWSKNHKEAMDFLNYLNDPNVAALNAEEISNATPNKTAKKYMSEEVIKDQALLLPEETLQRAQMYRILSDDTMRLRGRILDSLIKQHEAQ